MPEKYLGYGLVVPFLAHRCATLVSNNEDLNSLNRTIKIFMTWVNSFG